jgi:erythromycin esterase
MYRSILLLTAYSLFLNFGRIHAQAVNEKICYQYSITEFDEITAYINQRNLLLLGEANHGSHEMFTLKSSFIKYLVQNMRLKDVIIEANFANCLEINNFITWQTDGSVEELVRGIYVWPYRTREFADLITWMRESNKRKKSEEQVNLWGMDMQQAYPALKVLHDKLGHEIFNLPMFKDRMSEIKYTINDSTLLVISKAVENAKSDIQILERCLVIIQMQTRLMELISTKSKTVNQYRDSCMAENVNWIYQIGENKNRTLIWGHNSHIQKSHKSSMRKKSMGFYLNKIYGDDSYFIGFDFNQGTFIYPNPRQELLEVSEDERHYLARLLDESKYDICFIPFTEANQSILDKEVGMRYNYGLMKGRYANLYDAIFFINEVTPVRMLD